MQVYYGIMFLTDLILVCKPDLALRLFVCGKQLQRARSLISQGKASKTPRRRGVSQIEDSDISMSINPALMALSHSCKSRFLWPAR